MKLLLAIDPSFSSMPPVVETKTRPWPPGTLVRVFSVVEGDYPPGYIAEALITPPPGERSRQARQDEAWALVERVANGLREVGLDVEPCLGHGSPAPEIVEQARTWGPDLIVMGSHGRTGRRRVFLGSVAQHVVAHAPCSVEIARVRDENQAALAPVGTR